MTAACQVKTLIIGGGLSGLAVAHALTKQGAAFELIEARARLGGRIMTERQGTASFDMGPAWFWPGQPRIAALIARLGLTRFDQYADGALVFEDARGQVQQGRGFSSMQGSWRLQGGLSALTDALTHALPPEAVRLNSPASGIAKTPNGVRVTLAGGAQIDADRAVLALPPRLAAGITFVPELPAATVRSLQSVPTWMAGQAKAVAVYDTPFWRTAGLSGDAMSQCGPMVEIHDASPAIGGPFALFGFIGVPPEHRRDETVLRHHILAQLGRLFGAKGAEPTALFVKDWAFDPYTAVEADHAPLRAHPTYGPPPTFGDVWGNSVLFAGTEVAPEFGGYLEGALEAAEAVLQQLAAH